jgi:hypothetical protein
MVSVHAAESSKKRLLKLSPVRWMGRLESLIATLEIFYAIYYNLQEMSTWQDGDSSLSAVILMNSALETPFILSLYTLQKLFPL